MISKQTYLRECRSDERREDVPDYIKQYTHVNKGKNYNKKDEWDDFVYKVETENETITQHK